MYVSKEYISHFYTPIDRPYFDCSFSTHCICNIGTSQNARVNEKNDLAINMFNKGMNILLSKFREAFLSISGVVLRSLIICWA